MKRINNEEATGLFFNTLCHLTVLLQGSTWRFWYGALKKFIQKRDPFVADESDIAFCTEHTLLTAQGMLDSCIQHFGEDVIGQETATLFLKHATAVQAWKHNFVVGTDADLFGFALGVKDEVFYDEATINSFGLAFCEPSDVLLIRINLPDQEPGDSLCVMTRPLEDDGGKRFYFTVLRYLSHHPMPEKFRVIHTETQSQFSSTGRMRVFRLKE